MENARGGGLRPEELDQLELLEAPGLQKTAGMPSGGSDFLAARQGRGAPAPAFNPSAPFEYSRILFGGVLVLLGSWMPFGPGAEPGCFLLPGGICLLTGIGVVWSAWGAIHAGDFRTRWTVLALLPLAWSMAHVVKAFEEPAVLAWLRECPRTVRSWSDFLTAIVSIRPERLSEASAFARAFGPGKLFIFAGSAICQLYLLMVLFSLRRRGGSLPAPGKP